MNNKYKFIKNNAEPVEEIEVSQNIEIKKHGDYDLDFSGNYGVRNNDIITDGGIRRSYRSGPIVKTEIQQRLKNDFKEILSNISEQGYEIHCFKMNEITKNKLRAFFSYEVDYVPKGAGKEVVGTLMGKKIILDNTLPNFNMTCYVVVKKANVVGNRLKKLKFIQED